jgi:hypothetical protein
MLNEEEKARIRAEEEAKAQQKLEAQEERDKARAALEFRESVKVELNPKRAFRWWIPMLVFVLATAAGAGWWITRPKSPIISSAPVQGGIEDSELVSKCQTEVQTQLSFVGQLEFGLDDDAASQFFVSTDGKTWDSWVRYQDPKIGLMRRIFSCSFTVADCLFNVRFLDKE